MKNLAVFTTYDGMKQIPPHAIRVLQNWWTANTNRVDLKHNYEIIPILEVEAEIPMLLVEQWLVNQQLDKIIYELEPIETNDALERWFIEHGLNFDPDAQTRQYLTGQFNLTVQQLDGMLLKKRAQYTLLYNWYALNADFPFPTVKAIYCLAGYSRLPVSEICRWFNDQLKKDIRYYEPQEQNNDDNNNV